MGSSFAIPLKRPIALWKRRTPKLKMGKERCLMQQKRQRERQKKLSALKQKRSAKSKKMKTMMKMKMRQKKENSPRRNSKFFLKKDLRDKTSFRQNHNVEISRNLSNPHHVVGGSP